ncbi:hypothetical protein FRC12_022010 [Ceratobasidium sp. 428]|nr:hypothetical protein FRC12_022010 [Ceratobasidium sp. 428]
MLSAVNDAIRDSALKPLLDLNLGLADETANQIHQPESDGNIPSAQPFTLELDEIESQFASACSPAFNFETLQFRPALNHSSLRQDEILDALLPTAPSTHRFIYRVNALKSLALDLTSLQDSYGLPALGGSSPADVARFNTLVTAINVELNGLLSMAQTCLNEQERMLLVQANSGVKSYRFITPYSTGRFLPPVVMATTLLIAIIHSLMQVPRASCNVILSILRSILRLAYMGQQMHAHSYVATNIDSIPINLSTALSYLGLPTQLDIYTTCPKCSHLYAPSHLVPDSCGAVDLVGNVCHEPLLKVHHREIEPGRDQSAGIHISD